ncbi:MAG: S8 family serine peptidase [Gammaproteobacteria bacterium]
MPRVRALAFLCLAFLSLGIPPAALSDQAAREVLFVQMKDAPDLAPGDFAARVRRHADSADAVQRELRGCLPPRLAPAAAFEALPALNGWLVTLPRAEVRAARRALHSAPEVAFVAWHDGAAGAPEVLTNRDPPPTPLAAADDARRLTLAIIDLGADLAHPLLARTLGRVHAQPGTPGVAGDGRLLRSHGTAMIGVYAQLLSGTALSASGVVQPWLRLPRAVALSDTLIARAGPETRAGRSDLLRALDWMMRPAADRPRPDLINYSQGNGRLCAAAASCRPARRTAVTRVLDRLVDEAQLTLVKSAGNHGYGDDDTMTVPGDTWNGITVGNMHAYDWTRCAPGATREAHKIYRTSSVAPAAGARLLDLVAPGVRITTTGVDPAFCRRECGSRPDLPCTFCARLGRLDVARGGYWKTNSGTSPAAAIVGAVALYLIDEGLRDPRAVKAVLINSADAWTSDGAPHPQVRGDGRGCREDDVARRHGPYPYGSHYDRSYGYGYLNPARAAASAAHTRIDTVDATTPRCYTARLEAWDKLTLVWHRHAQDAEPSDLRLALLDALDLGIVDSDEARRLDTLRQVSNGRDAVARPRARNVVVRLEAAARERYALASARPLRPLAHCPDTSAAP